MFSLLNAVQVIPVVAVDFVQQTLARGDVQVPVLLKGHQDRAGWLTLCGWVPGQAEPVYQHVPTEMVVCPAERGKLQAALEAFCDEIKSRERSEQAAFLTGLGVAAGAR